MPARSTDEVWVCRGGSGSAGDGVMDGDVHARGRFRGHGGKGRKMDPSMWSLPALSRCAATGGRRHEATERESSRKISSTKTLSMQAMSVREKRREYMTSRADIDTC